MDVPEVKGIFFLSCFIADCPGEHWPPTLSAAHFWDLTAAAVLALVSRKIPIVNKKGLKIFRTGRGLFSL